MGEAGGCPGEQTPLARDRWRTERGFRVPRRCATWPEVTLLPTPYDHPPGPSPLGLAHAPTPTQPMVLANT